MDIINVNIDVINMVIAEIGFEFVSYDWNVVILIGIEVAVDASISFEIHHAFYLKLQYIAIIDVLNEWQSGD